MPGKRNSDAHYNSVQTYLNDKQYRQLDHFRAKHGFATISSVARFLRIGKV